MDNPLIRVMALHVLVYCECLFYLSVHSRRDVAAIFLHEPTQISSQKWLAGPDHSIAL